jgi:hypothetical protein
MEFLIAALFQLVIQFLTCFETSLLKYMKNISGQHIIFLGYCHHTHYTDDESKKDVTQVSLHPSA